MHCLAMQHMPVLPRSYSRLSRSQAPHFALPPHGEACARASLRCARLAGNHRLAPCPPPSAGGDFTNVFQWVQDNGGVDSDSHWPYQAKETSCPRRRMKRWAGLRGCGCCADTAGLPGAGGWAARVRATSQEGVWSFGRRTDATFAHVLLGQQREFWGPILAALSSHATTVPAAPLPPSRHRVVTIDGHVDVPKHNETALMQSVSHTVRAHAVSPSLSLWLGVWGRIQLPALPVEEEPWQSLPPPETRAHHLSLLLGLARDKRPGAAVPEA